MTVICKMTGEKGTLPCPSPGCPFYGDCMAFWESQFYKKPMTNADRIRAMTDEELAEFLDKCEARGYQDSSIARDALDHCIDMLDWLQQPCGGTDHEYD